MGPGAGARGPAQVPPGKRLSGRGDGGRPPKGGRGACKGSSSTSWRSTVQTCAVGHGPRDVILAGEAVPRECGHRLPGDSALLPLRVTRRTSTGAVSSGKRARRERHPPRSPSSRRFSFAAASSDPRNVHRCGQLRETSTPRVTSTRCGPVPGSGPSTWSARRSGGAPRRDAHFRAMASMNPGAGGAAVLSKTRAWCRWWMRPLRSCKTTVWTSVQRGNLPRTSTRRFIPRAPW